MGVNSGGSAAVPTAGRKSRASPFHHRPSTTISEHLLYASGTIKMKRQKRQADGTRSVRQGHVVVTQQSGTGDPLTFPRQVTHLSFRGQAPDTPLEEHGFALPSRSND